MNEQFHVYLLSDPRDGRAFYVGKGTAAPGGAPSHEVAPPDEADRSARAGKIREILHAGLEVRREIVRCFENEEEAGDFEAIMIAAIGLGNLTNDNAGGAGGKGRKAAADPLQTVGKSDEEREAEEAWESLTAKQRAFVEEYCKNGNATQAAIDAGYSVKTAAVTGHENLRKPRIASIIEARRREHREHSNVTVEWLTGQLEENLIKARKMAQLGAANGAVVNIAKLHGLLVDRQRHEGGVGGNVTIEVSTGVPRSPGE